MTRTGQTIGRRILTALLCLSFLGWSLLPSLAHVPRIAETLQDQAEMFAGHGHVHGPQEDLMAALHGHSHDAVDHDHSPALAVATQGGKAWPTSRDAWRLRAAQSGPDRTFRIERPPRA